MEDLLTLAQNACDAAVQAEAEFVDVSAYRGKSMNVELEKNAIKSCDVRWNSGVSVRAFVRGGTGWSSTSGLEEQDVLAVARQAAELARAAEPDPDFVSLPGPAEYEEVEGLYDPRIVELDVKDLIGWATMNIDAARSVDDGAIVSGGGGCGFGESALVNSLGVQALSRSTSVGMSIFAIVKRPGDDVGSFFEFDGGRMRDDFEPEGLGVKATEQAMKFLGARKIETGTLPVIFGPLASRSIFYSLCYNANAEDVQRKRSYLIGKKGEQIASDLLTLTDNALLPRGQGSSAYDGEGFPRQPLTVVENGVLQTYLHNSYTANKAKEPNTGHSTRGGISPTNVNPRLGQVTSAEIIADTKEGLYINMGGVSPNSVTGDFSETVDFGFKIENGELAYPVKNTMLGGHILEFLRNLDAISSDYREEPGSIMPTLRVQNVRVAGGK
jgi:PmbA protein